jgi:hypothetical protein
LYKFVNPYQVTLTTMANIKVTASNNVQLSLPTERSVLWSTTVKVKEFKLWNFVWTWTVTFKYELKSSASSQGVNLEFWSWWTRIAYQSIIATTSYAAYSNEWVSVTQWEDIEVKLGWDSSLWWSYGFVRNLTVCYDEAQAVPRLPSVITD